VGGTPSPDNPAWGLMGAIPTPMALSDPSGVLLGVNHHLCTAVGRDEAELLQGGIGDLLDPRDAAEDESLLRRLLDGEIGPYQARQRLRTGGGGVMAVRCLVWLAAATAERAGDRPGVLRLFHSVGPGDAGSVRHAAVIVASSGDALTGYSVDGEITHWNPAAEQLYHLPAERAVGRNMWEVLPADWAADVARALERVVRGERIDTTRRVGPAPTARRSRWR
jgi:PAS domain S-box-containing protein